MEPISRIHHISATVGDPNENLKFYRDVLGLRLVKQTVNFEDNGTYHLYFANQHADSGTIMTFFPLTNDLYGRVGAGQVRRIAFAIPKGTNKNWKNQLDKEHINYIEDSRFGATGLFFNDPHHLSLAVVESENDAPTNDILGFYGVELLSTNPDETLKQLLNEMGLNLLKVEKDYYHLSMVGSEQHKVLVNRTVTQKGRLGIGTVHHIAWSVSDDKSLQKFKEHLEKEKPVTELRDRKYFKSVYFKDPGQIIYELATEGPGFNVDEPIEQLGTKLMLPEKYENQRSAIEATLPKLNI